MDLDDFNASVGEVSTCITEYLNVTNVTQASAPDYDPPQPAEMAKWAAVVTLVVGVVGITGDVLNVLVACDKQFEFPISNRVAIVSMSMADLFLDTLNFLVAIFYRRLVYICGVVVVWYLICAQVSVISLVLIIVDRYFAIAMPFRHLRYATKTVSIVVLVTVWCLIAIIT